jgi:hypothetical protein
MNIPRHQKKQKLDKKPVEKSGVFALPCRDRDWKPLSPSHDPRLHRALAELTR